MLRQQRRSFLVACHQLQIVHHTLAKRILHLSGFFVADPDVETSTAGKDVHELVKIKVLG